MTYRQAVKYCKQHPWNPIGLRTGENTCYNPKLDMEMNFNSVSEKIQHFDFIGCEQLITLDIRKSDGWKLGKFFEDDDLSAGDGG
jgi:hypothetical protein